MEITNYGSVTSKVNGIVGGQLWISVDSGQPTGGPYKPGDAAIGLVDGYMWVNTVAGSPGTWQQVGTGFLAGAVHITSNSATAFTVGPNGLTNPVFTVDASASSQAAGIIVKGFAAGVGASLAVQSSSADEPLYIDAKGSGNIVLNRTATGNTLIGNGNLVFNNGGQRIVGNFTDSTNANRVLFQTSTSNAATSVGAIPTGSGLGGSFASYGSSDPNNSSIFVIANNNTNSFLNSTSSGTGSIQPLMLQSSGIAYLTIPTTGGVEVTNGNLMFATTGQKIVGDFNNATHSNRVVFQSATNGTTSVGVLPNGTGTIAQSVYYNNSDRTAALADLVVGMSATTGFVSSNILNGGTAVPLGLQIAGTQYLTIPTTGGVQVNSGNLGVNTAPVTYNGISISGGLTGSVQPIGVAAQAAYSSSATTGGIGVLGQVNTAVASFTMNSAFSFYAQNGTKGSGSSVNNSYGYYSESVTLGGQNNYGVYVEHPSGASTNNISIVAAGGGIVHDGGFLCSYAGSLLGTYSGANGATVSSATNTILHYVSANNITINESPGLFAGIEGRIGGLVVNSGKTVGRVASLYAGWASNTFTGTVTNANALYLDTPSGGGTNRVIDSAVGFQVRTDGSITTNAGTFLHSSTALTNGAASSAGTLTNAPAVGNPTKWIPIDDNGTTRYIPCW